MCGQAASRAVPLRRDNRLKFTRENTVWVRTDRSRHMAGVGVAEFRKLCATVLDWQRGRK